MQTSTQKFGNLLKTGIKVGGVAAAAGIGFAIKGFADFDAAMTKSLAIMGDVSDELRVEMTKAAREMALKTTFSAKDAAESYFFLASAGLDAGASIKALPVVASFAQAGMFDMALATDLLTDAQSALGLAIKNDAVANMENMVRISDVLVKANTLANATVQQFSESLTSEAGAAMKAFNIDIEEGVAVLAAFADQGVKGQVAGTGLSRILRLMTSAAVSNSEAYEELGVRVFDASGNLNNMADIIGDLEVALGDMSDAQRVAALEALGFQARVQGVILPLLGTSDAIREYEAGLRDAGDITQQVAEKQLDTFNAQMNLLMSAITDVAIELGSVLVPILREFVEHLRSDIVPMLKEWVELHRDDIENAIRGTIKAVDDLLNALKPFFDDFILGLKTLKPLVIGLFEFVIKNKAAMVVAIAAIGTAIVLHFGPFSAAALAIGALIALIGTLARDLKSADSFIADVLLIATKGIVDLRTEAGKAQDTFEDVGIWFGPKPWEDTAEAIERTIAPMESVANEAARMRRNAGILNEELEEGEEQFGEWGGGADDAADAAGAAADEIEEAARAAAELSLELVALHSATSLQTVLNQEATIAGHEFAVILREVEGASVELEDILRIQIEVLQDQIAVLQDTSGSDIMIGAIEDTIEALENEIVALGDTQEKLILFGEDGIGPITAQLFDLRDAVEEVEAALSGFSDLQTQREAEIEAEIADRERQITLIDDLAGATETLTVFEQNSLDVLNKKIPRLEDELEALKPVIEALTEKKKEGEELTKQEREELKLAKERRAEIRELLKGFKATIKRLEEKAGSETAAGKAAREHVEDIEDEIAALEDEDEAIKATKKATVEGLEALIEGRPTLDEWIRGIVEQGIQTGILTGKLDDVPPALQEWIRTHGDFVFEVGRGMNRLLLAQRDFVDDSIDDSQRWADAWTQAAQDIIDGMEEVLDAGSPSKEMMRIGEAMREGLELGLTGGASVPVLAGGGVARDAITPAALPPVPVAPPAGAGDFTANISVGTESEVAEEVGREMQRLAFGLKRS